MLAQSSTEALDEVVQSVDQAVSARESKAERTMRDALAERGRSGEDRQSLLDDLLTIITDPAVPDDQAGGLIRGGRVGWPRLRSAMAQVTSRLPRDHGRLAALKGSYGCLLPGDGGHRRRFSALRGVVPACAAGMCSCRARTGMATRRLTC
ncbi:hypothetical protein [Microbispora sp. NPDC049125]|uniref:hypothetical protein n=1 Tax=Microbispora sp. NPDC049125 TaxID=3154929 RepID=UPI0034657353